MQRRARARRWPGPSFQLRRVSLSNSNMAGGDFDGDLNMVSFYDPWVNLVEMTAEAVDKAKMPDHEKAKR